MRYYLFFPFAFKKSCKAWFYALTLSGFFVPACLMAQAPHNAMEPPVAASTNFPFINLQENNWQVFNPQVLARFWEKLASLEQDRDEKVHIYQLGDSHIQADIFSGYFRNRLINDPRFPVNARGFIFPYNAAQTNNPYNYKVSYTGQWEGKRSVKSKNFSRWGLAGITTETSSPEASLTVYPNSQRDVYQIQKVKIFYPTEDPSQFDAIVLPDEGNYLLSYFAGQGYIEFVLQNPQPSVKIQLKKSASKQYRFTLQGIFLDSMEPSIVYSASGVNAADVTSYFRCEDLERNVYALSPDLLIISLGTNDAYMYAFDAGKFKADLITLIRKIRKYSPETDILLTTPGDNFRKRKYQNKNNELARIKMLEVAAEMDVAVWDFYSVMGGLESMNHWYSAGLAQRDKLHLTMRGYEVQGELMYQAFEQAYLNYKRTRLGKI
jgi:lysophospholipase L1-like esterase